QRARLGRGTRKGDFLAGPAAFPGERRLLARPVCESHRRRLEGEGDLLALPDVRRGQRALADGHRAQRAGAGGDAVEGALPGRPVLVWALVAGPAGAQRLAARVAAAPDGTVRLSFAARPGVCGDGQSVIAFECAGGKCGRGRWGRTITVDRGFDDDEVEYDCEPGPVRVSLRVRTGRVQSLRTYVAGRWVTPPRDAAVTDLGTVSARDAVDFLLGLATREGTRAG